MSAGFKAQVKRDLAAVFHNAQEHADMMKVEYNGKKYKIPVITDSDSNKDRVKVMRDNADGVFISDMTVFISLYDLKIVPRKETRIIIDDTEYMIVRVGNDAGGLTLDLEIFDE
jgi:hypothetical protein